MLEGTFNLEKALVEVFFVIVKLQISRRFVSSSKGHITCWVAEPRLRRMARPHLGITGDQVLTSSDPGILIGSPEQELTTSDHSHYSGMRV